MINASHVTVQRCTSQEFGFAIGTANDVSGLLIQANTLHNNVKGIRFGEPVTDSRAIGNTANDNTEFGIQFKNGPVGNLVQGDTTINNGRVGIQINQEARHNRIILNYVSGNGSRGGIRVDARSSDNLIEGKFVEGGMSPPRPQARGINGYGRRSSTAARRARQSRPKADGACAGSRSCTSPSPRRCAVSRLP
jgi:Right handed beta helix region